MVTIDKEEKLLHQEQDPCRFKLPQKKMSWLDK